MAFSNHLGAKKISMGLNLKPTSTREYEGRLINRSVAE
jgi:hypothetical protein